MNTLKAEGGTQKAVKERPILFSGPMVRALLDGRKTQTRRIVKVQPHMPQTNGCVLTVDGWQYTHLTGNSGKCELLQGESFLCPYGAPGDRLWVRENISKPFPDDVKARQFTGFYQATDSERKIRWTPSIHMPRWASRITLEITGVRVERLQDISKEDAIAEGLYQWTHSHKDPAPYYGIQHADVWETDPRKTYERLWGDINGKESWAVNPCVWVVEFKRVEAGA